MEQREARHDFHSDNPLRTVLVAYDLSELAETALAYAMDLSLRFGSKIIAVYVQKPADLSDSFDSRYSIVGLDLEAEMELLKQRLSGAAIEHQVLHRTGTMSDVLISEASRHQVDLVVFGAYGSNDLDSAMLGSNSEELIRSMSCSVLIVGPEVVMYDYQKDPRFQILYVTSGTRREWPIRFTEYVAQRTFSQVQIALVADHLSQGLPNGETLRLQGQCIDVARHMRVNNLTAGWQLLYTQPATVIAEVSREIRAGLILLDSAVDIERSFGATNVVSITVRHAPCPVLALAKKAGTDEAGLPTRS